MKKMRRSKLWLMMLSLAMIFSMTCNSVFAQETERTFTVSNFDEFKQAVQDIEGDTQYDSFVISLTDDIDFAASGFNAEFRKNTVILGNGHTINLGTELSYGGINILNGATLSLGKENPTGNENVLTITVEEPAVGYRSRALIIIGGLGDRGTGVLNMYDGVELTGSKTNGSSMASAVNIQNGVFNMYGGEIHGNTNLATAGMSGAVAGRNDSDYKITFNMYGGSIHDNTTDSRISSYSGAIFLFDGAMNMYGGEIINNHANRASTSMYNYGGGVSLYNSSAVFDKGTISGNTGSTYGGGIYADQNSKITINSGFVITANTASYGGGLNYNSTAESVIHDGAVIANNTATNGGADITFYSKNGNSLTLGSAGSMNAVLTTDGSNKNISGWYVDSLNNRWDPDAAEEVDVSSPLSDATVHLVAAYENEYSVNYSFVSSTADKELPNEVLELLPSDSQVYKKGDVIKPVAPIKTHVVVSDGEWVFKGYDAEEKLIEEAVTEFVGTWEFIEKIEYKVIYRFESTAADKELPNEVMELLPSDSQVYELGDVVAPVMPIKTSVSVSDGEWAFKGYDAEEKPIEEAVTEFVGTWEFSENPHIGTDDNINEDADDSNNVHGNESTPSTDDSSHLWLFTSTLLISGLLIAIVLVLKKKQEISER